MKVRLNHRRLARELARRNVSQNRWSQLLGISRSYLSMLLNGQRPYPGPNVRRRLLEKLELDFDELFVVEPFPRRERVGPPYRRTNPGIQARKVHMYQIWEDIVYGIRMLTRNRGFTTVAVLTLAVGIAATTAVFSVANGLLWKPLPYPRWEELVFLNELYLPGPRQESGVSWLNFQDWKVANKSFSSMAAYDTTSVILRGVEGSAVRISGVAVSGGFFEVLQVPAALGQTFGTGSGIDETSPVAVLSDDLWKSYFGGDPDLIGKTVSIDGKPTLIVGVMPAGFRFPERHQLWIPLQRGSYRESRQDRFLDIVARLKPNTTLATARLDLSGIARQLSADYPEANGEFAVFMVPFREDNVGSDDRQLMTVLLGVVLFVLLIACVNVANLSLARATVRAPEMSVRMTLGADRLRILRQLLTEAVVMATTGGAVGFLVGVWLQRILTQSMPDELPTWMDFSADGRVVLFVTAISLISGLFVGLGPALQCARHRPSGALQVETVRGGESRRGVWMRGALVVSEVALATTLLIGTGLIMRSYINYQRVDLGFNPAGVLTLRTYLMESKYTEPGRRVQFYSRLLEELNSVPGVAAATAASWLPLQGFTGTYLTAAEGAPEQRGQVVIAYMTVFPGYFRTAQTPLIEGREFDDRDGLEEPEPVLIVNRRLAARYWPGESALGRRIRLGDETWYTIVGVSADAHLTERGREQMMALYAPYRQRPDHTMTLLVRGHDSAPTELVPAIRARVAAIDPDGALARIESWQETVRLSNWEETLFGWVFVVFSALAGLLASVGLYGVVAYSVAQRRHEIGIRVAVGAKARDVVRLVLSKGMTLAVAGVVIGLAGSTWLMKALAGLLLGVSPTDPATFLVVAACLVGITLVASYVPARRAARVDPIDTLRV